MKQAAGDLILGLATAAFGLLILLEARSIREPVFETFGAAPVPRTAAVILIALSLVLVLRAVPHLARGRSLMALRPDLSAWARTGGTVAIVFAHAAAIAFWGLGFIEATIPALVLMFLVLGGARPRYLAAAALVAVLTAAGIFLAFTRLFQIDLP